VNNILLLSAVSTAVLTASTLADVHIDSNLAEHMKTVGSKGIVSALVYLDDQVDIKALSESISQENMRFQDRHQLVVETLQTIATESQLDILTQIESLQKTETITTVDPYWISNVIRVDATPSVINQLAKRDDVMHIYLNYPIELVAPVSTGPVGEGSASRGGPEQGLIAIRADEAWSMGYTGEGVLVATLDTGVQGSHEALASLMAHTPWALFVVERQGTVLVLRLMHIGLHQRASTGDQLLKLLQIRLNHFNGSWTLMEIH